MKQSKTPKWSETAQAEHSEVRRYDRLITIKAADLNPVVNSNGDVELTVPSAEPDHGMIRQLIEFHLPDGSEMERQALHHVMVDAIVEASLLGILKDRMQR